MRWLIVDDEPLARARMARLLREAGETVSGEAGHLAAAVACAAALGEALDAVALDIEMPGPPSRSTGGWAGASQDASRTDDGQPRDVFEWVRRLKAASPQRFVVLVSAHAQFGPAAFESAVDDYLLKPVEAARVGLMLDRLRRRATPAVVEASQPAPTLVIRIGRTMRRVAITSIGAFEASGGTTIVHWVEAERGREVLREGVVDASLSELETRLGTAFLRTHRSWLVRCDAVRAVDTRGHETSLDVHGVAARVPVSRRQTATMRELLSARPFDR